MGLINREKQRTRQARKDRGAAYFCVCGGTCPPLLFGALPVTPGSAEDAWPPWRSRAHGASPRSLPWVPRLRTRLPPRPEQRACILGPINGGWRFNSGAPLRTSLRHGASCALYASDRPVDHLRPPNCRVTSAKAPPPSRVALPQPPDRWALAPLPPLSLPGGVRGFAYAPRYPGRLVLLHYAAATPLVTRSLPLRFLPQCDSTVHSLANKARPGSRRATLPRPRALSFSAPVTGSAPSSAV